jgi:hypothetical protein
MSEHGKGTFLLLSSPITFSSRRQDLRRSVIPRGAPARSLMAFVCILALLLSTTTPALATGGADPTNVVVDVLVARPISFAATAVGATLFVVSLPFAAASRTVKETTQTLVAAPAKDLFTRPVGDLEDWLSYW